MAVAYSFDEHILDLIMMRRVGCSTRQYRSMARQIDLNNKRVLGLVVNDRKCNLCCKHCFMSAGPGGQDLPVETVMQAASLGMSAGFHVIRPHFTEMYNGDLDHHQRLIESLGYERRHTNGEMLAAFEDTGELLSAVDRIKGQQDFGLSIHGFEKHHDYLVGRKGHWSRLVRLAERLVSLGLQVRVNSCFTALNAADVEPWGRFLNSIGVSCMLLDRLSFTGRAMEKCRGILPDRRGIRVMIKGLFRLRGMYSPELLRVSLGVHFGPNLLQGSYYRLHLRHVPFLDGRESYGGSTFCTAMQFGDTGPTSVSAYPVSPTRFKIVPCITFPQKDIELGWIDVEKGVFTIDHLAVERLRASLSSRPTTGDCARCPGWEICRGGCRAAAYGASLAQGRPDLSHGFQDCFTHVVLELLAEGDPDIPSDLL